MKYSIVIQWSEGDQKYIASLPEFGSFAHTHGQTYEEALANAQDCLAELVAAYQQSGMSLPEPQQFSPEQVLQPV